MSTPTTCRACRATLPAGVDHCPHCLSATHQTDLYGDMCGGTLVPISVWVRPDGKWEVIGRCAVCGELVAFPVIDKDNPTLLLSIAHRPLANPPFPIEKMEEMTAAMGGSGNTEGYNQ